VSRRVPRGSLRAVAAVARRPDLWVTATSTAASIVPRRWWRRFPYLPLPDAAWMHFRLETAYGGDGRGPVRPEDLITYLEWRKAF
jgi:hypothetical protein